MPLNTEYKIAGFISSLINSGKDINTIFNELSQFFSEQLKIKEIALIKNENGKLKFLKSSNEYIYNYLKPHIKNNKIKTPEILVYPVGNRIKPHAYFVILVKDSALMNIFNSKSNNFGFLLNQVFLPCFAANKYNLFDLQEIIELLKEDNQVLKNEIHKTKNKYEKTIREKTEELNNSRIAALNLMQDANIQNKKLQDTLNNLKSSNEKIYRLNRQLSFILDSTKTGIYIIDAGYGLKFVSEGWTELYGSYTGKKCYEYFHGRSDICENCTSGKSLKEKQKSRFEIRMANEDNRPVEIISIPFNDYDNNYVSAQVALDISPQKEMEENLRKSMQEAEESNKLKSIFLANMSHEIRTPLNSIIGFSEILNELIKNDVQKGYLSSIISSGKSLLSIINGILDISKIESGKINLDKEPVNIKNIINELIPIFESECHKKGIEFITENNFELNAYISIDEEKIKQVLINLISNAIKFTEEGYIKVTTNLFVNNNNHVDCIIKVEDSGIGIEDSQKDKIFEIFSQADQQDNKKFGGTGLGLTISKRIVELHGGSIHVKSTKNKGSIFTVNLSDLTYIEFFNEEKIKNNQETIKVQFNNEKVLIIDDVKENFEVTGGLLDLYGLQSFYASNGKEGIEKAKDIKPKFIFCDIKMPDMSGYDVAKEIKNHVELEDTKIIAFTAVTLDETKTNLFDNCLFKPVNSKNIISVLEKYSNPLKNIKQNNKENDAFFITDDNEHKKAIKEKVEKQLIPKYSNLIKRISLKEARIFLDELDEIFYNLSDESVRNYQKTLRISVESFDINGIRKNIANFKDIIKSLNIEENG